MERIVITFLPQIAYKRTNIYTRNQFFVTSGVSINLKLMKSQSFQGVKSFSDLGVLKGGGEAGMPDNSCFQEDPSSSISSSAISSNSRYFRGLSG